MLNLQISEQRYIFVCIFAKYKGKLFYKNSESGNKKALIPYFILKMAYLNYIFFDISGIDSLKTHGDNQKKMLILLNENDTASSDCMDLLRKIMSAIKYNLDTDCLLITAVEDSKITLSSLVAQHEVQHVLAFGFLPAKLGFYANTKKYAFTTLNDAQYLFGDSLNQMATQQQLKAALWDALRMKFIG